jgi:hypothetical protein
MKEHRSGLGSKTFRPMVRSPFMTFYAALHPVLLERLL